MSNIVVLVDETSVPAASLMQLKSITGFGLSEVRGLLTKGSPIFEQEIFDSRYEEHAKQLRTILDFLEKSKFKHRVYELPEDETSESCSLDEFQIADQVLKNILDNADEELDRQFGEIQE